MYLIPLMWPITPQLPFTPFFFNKRAPSAPSSEAQPCGRAGWGVGSGSVEHWSWEAFGNRWQCAFLPLPPLLAARNAAQRPPPWLPGVGALLPCLFSDILNLG